MNRLASTRSENRARHPGWGLPQCRVGSIDGEGMRYGLTTYALTSRTIATAATIVTIQSIAMRHGRGNRSRKRGRYIDGLRIEYQRMPRESFSGHLDLLLLAALRRGPLHGYAISEHIRLSGGRFDYPDGTIYPALN